MLILRRREGESILIGDDIEIEVVQIGANRVKIGVRAPVSVRVLRREVHLIGTENSIAGSMSVDLQRAIVDRLCGKKFLNIPVHEPISTLTDTLGIP